MIESRNVIDLTTITSGTINIPVENTVPPSCVYGDTSNYYRVTADTEVTLTGTLSFSALGTPSPNTFVKFYFEKAIVVGSNALNIFGVDINGRYSGELFGSGVNDPLTVDCLYRNATDGWAVYMNVNADASSTPVITSKIKDDAVTTAKIADDAVTFAKMQDAPANSSGTGGTVVVGNDKDAGATLSAFEVDDAQILIGNADGFTAAALSGDVTMTNAGVVALTANSVVTADITDANVTTAKIADDNVTTAKIADANVTLAKLGSTGKLASAYADVGTPASTVETTLFTTTLAASQLAADGESVRMTAYGETAANANTKTLKVYLGASVIAQNSTTTAPNGKNWKIVADVTRSGATSSVEHISIEFDGVAAEVDVSKAGTTWSSANALAVTGTNGTSALNDIVLKQAIVEYIK
jgi:hypothetical protein